MEDTITALSELQSVNKYRQEREHLFPSSGSLAWYIRQHKPALIKAGALLLIRGAWQVHAKAFDAYVLSTGASEALQQQASPTRMSR